MKFICRPKIQTAIEIKSMIEQEMSVSKKLKVEYIDVIENTNDFKEVISQIQKEKHPILHRYIEMIAKE